MKKILVMAVLLAMGVGLKTLANDETVCFTVNPPMSCANCENKIKSNLRFEKGVKSVKPSAKEGVVEIVYDDSKTSLPKLVEGFKKIGYVASPVQKPEVCPEEGASPATYCPTE